MNNAPTRRYRSPEEEEPLGPLSLEDRQRLVAERGALLQLLLDMAFSDFYEAKDLHPYGFKGDQPVAEAVAWALEFFASERFKPEKLRERTLRLFTIPDFWLHLKVGRQAMGARKGWRPKEGALERVTASAAPPERQRQDRALAETRAHMGETLGQLRARTCASVVAHWLEGSERLRATLFNWEARAQSPDEDLSKGARSKLRHDAQFRYICLFIDLLDDSSPDEPHQAVLRISFSPCEDRRPYRVRESQVAKDWPRPVAPKELLGLRKQGLRRLIPLALREAERPAEAPVERLRSLVLRHGLSKTTAHVYKLQDEEDDALVARLEALPKPEVRG